MRLESRTSTRSLRLRSSSPPRRPQPEHASPRLARSPDRFGTSDDVVAGTESSVELVEPARSRVDPADRSRPGPARAGALGGAPGIEADRERAEPGVRQRLL